MAKQNFLAGGFYGKLGATVGQRWKNIRTIRTYVIPHNPRTPKQQANRSKFSQAVPYAQLGQQVNYKSILFQSESKVEWSIRMSSAIANMNEGMTDVGIVPTYPKDFTPPHIITSANITGIELKESFDLTVEGDLPSGARKYACILYLSDQPEEMQYLISYGESTAGNPNVIQFKNIYAEILQNAPVTGKIISVDDESSETVVASPKLAISYEGKLLWSWSYPTMYAGGSIDGSFYLGLKKEGLGDGSYTGELALNLSSGKATFELLDGTLITRSVEEFTLSRIYDDHDNNENILHFVYNANVPATMANPVVEVTFDVRGVLSCHNYKQNGYDNLYSATVSCIWQQKVAVEE